MVCLEDRPRRLEELLAPTSLDWEAPPLLSPDQERACQAINAAIKQQAFAPFLLHGVTASGKTEVYLQAAQEALALGKGVLVLLPEIALTDPVGQAFRQRFGPRVALLHSGLSPQCPSGSVAAPGPGRDGHCGGGQVSLICSGF